MSEHYDVESVFRSTLNEAADDEQRVVVYAGGHRFSGYVFAIVGSLTFSLSEKPGEYYPQTEIAFRSVEAIHLPEAPASEVEDV